jgi:hypothetical protein
VKKTQLALAVAAGYLLGRTRKLRWALALAGVGASRGLPKSPGGLAAQGMQLVGSSPEARQLAETVRGRLTEAGRGPPVAGARRPIDRPIAPPDPLTR